MQESPRGRRLPSGRALIARRLRSSRPGDDDRSACTLRRVRSAPAAAWSALEAQRRSSSRPPRDSRGGPFRARARRMRRRRRERQSPIALSLRRLQGTCERADLDRALGKLCHRDSVTIPAAAAQVLVTQRQCDEQPPDTPAPRARSPVGRPPGHVGTRVPPSMRERIRGNHRARGCGPRRPSGEDRHRGAG